MSLFLARKKILKDIKTLVIKDGWNDQLFFNYSKKYKNFPILNELPDKEFSFQSTGAFYL